MKRDDVVRLVLEAAQGIPHETASVLAETLYLPVASWLADAALDSRGAAGRGPFVASLGGLPGTGKSTLARVLERLLEEDSGLRVARFSLDDLYLSGASRRQLAATVHPLFEQRGPPGTHDVALGLSLLFELRRAAANTRTALPRFDKLTDEPHPESDWPVFVGRPDVVLLDGWFWGARPSPASEIEPPLNERERSEDPSGMWRRAVQAALRIDYPELFSSSEFHVQLVAPSHASSVRWRSEQGRELLRQRGHDPAEHDVEKTRHFLALFERVGRLPQLLPRGVHVELDEAHLVRSATLVSEAERPGRA